MEEKKKKTTRAKAKKPTSKKIKLVKTAYEFRLANKIGDVITMDNDLAKKMIEKGYAVEV